MDLINRSDKEILTVATPMMDNLMDASTNNDFERHIRDFSERIKEKYTKDEFQRQCKDYRAKFGVFTDREFLGTTKAGNIVTVYWKQKVSKTDNEFLAVLTLSQKDDRYRVERVFIDLWQLESKYSH